VHTKDKSFDFFAKSLQPHQCRLLALVRKMLFGRKKSEKKKEMTAFERRQSMATKFEQEENAKSGIPPAPPPVEEIKSIRRGSTATQSPPRPMSHERKPADPEYVEFTIVPILLRAGVSYDEANRYGTTLKMLSEAEVKVIMANAMSLVDDVKKCGIKTSPTFEKEIHDDMFWQAGRGTNRKSFVYYKASTDSPEARPKSDSSYGSDPIQQTKEATRQRQSFSGPSLPVLEETDANRYKVKSRPKQAESLSHDLADLVSSLDAITKKQ